MSATTEPPAGFTPVPFVTDASRELALEGLAAAYAQPHGLSILTGAPGCGLSALVSEHLQRIGKKHDGDVVAVHIDVRGATVAGVLLSILDRFGYPLPDANETESLAMTHVIAQHQTDHGTPPILAFDNVDEAKPPILKLIVELANMKQQRQSTYRMVLAGGDGLSHIIAAEVMKPVRKRVACEARVEAMAEAESRQLIQMLLEANQQETDDQSVEVLWHAGRGLPGRITRLVADSVGAHAPLPADMLSPTGDAFEEPSDATEIRRIPGDAQTSVPFDDGGTETLGDDQAPYGEILVNCNGELLERYVIRRRKVLIGRAPHNDIVLPSRWVSRHHAIIICKPDGASLIDVNSTNGMTVNSRQVRQQALMHSDIVVIGDYRLKYRNARARRRDEADPLSETRVQRILAPEVAKREAESPITTKRRRPRRKR
ncbi:MAG: FHA domain-containing protein [Pseudomonadota bacterium]